MTMREVTLKELQTFRFRSLFTDLLMILVTFSCHERGVMGFWLGSFCVVCFCLGFFNLIVLLFISHFLSSCYKIILLRWEQGFLPAYIPVLHIAKLGKQPTENGWHF